MIIVISNDDENRMNLPKKYRELKMKNKPRIVAIIQARMQSKRLPGKVLLPLAGKPVLWWMLKRASLAKSVNEIVIATTDNPTNRPILDLVQRKTKDIPILHSCFIYDGDEEDVLSRVLAAASYFKADIIVDLTADCPMIDPQHIDYLIEILLRDNNLDYVSDCVYRNLDYVSNCVYRDWIDGADLQIYWTDALMKLKRIFNPPNHVGWNITRHLETFNVQHWKAPKDMHLPDWGLTLDEYSDYKLLQLIFNKFGENPGFKLEDVIYFLKDNPKLLEINKKVKRKNPEKEG